MDDPRKHAILFAATVFAARKLNELGDRPSLAREVYIADAREQARELHIGYPGVAAWTWLWRRGHGRPFQHVL